MTSRERMIHIIDGSVVDHMPVAPMFWGNDYSWRLVNRPKWEMIHGPADIYLERLSALDTRHQCDWLLVMFPGTDLLSGKRLVRELSHQAIFVEESSGDEWIFDKLTGYFEPLNHRNDKIHPSIPRNRAEVNDILKSPSFHFVYPMIAPTTDVRTLFPDRFLCGATPIPFSELTSYLGFHNRIQLFEDNPALCTYMAELLLGDVETLALRYANDGLDAAILFDWWKPADTEFYRNWIAPIHKRIALAFANVGLKSIFYLHRDDISGCLSEILNVINGLGFDAIAFEESGDGIDINLAEARLALGTTTCIVGNLDPQLLLATEFDVARIETNRQLNEAGKPFIFSTGSAVLDNTDPLVIKKWISIARNGNG